MTTATNTLPELASDYTISDGQIAEYQQNGHILLRGVLSQKETAAYRPYITQAVARYNTQSVPLAERDDYGKAFLQIMNLWVRDEMVKRYTLARRFGRIAAGLMGVQGVRIYHDQALYKEAGGGITPWHQDQYYWPLATDHTVTMWMPLINVTPEMGTLVFASRSHQAGYLGKLPISKESEEVFQRYVREKGYPLAPMPAMAAGDATFHTGWTLHTAPGNSSGITREVMTIIYVADGTRISEPDNKNREADLVAWMAGQKPGELVGSPLNPLVYRS